jgi:ATP-dependent Clp protease ATP-binding subunit ClpC
MFERFTNRARRVLVLAQEEASSMNHSFIGTEHILLGLIGEGEGVAAKALASLDISLVPVREQIEKTMGTAGTPPSGSPPFTPRAKKVLELSLREALQLGHSYIGTEHMLLGIVREGEGVATAILVGLGADQIKVRQRVTSLMAEAEGQSQAGRAVAGAAGSSSFDDDPLAAPEPRCPHCRTALEHTARYRTMAAAPDDDSDDRRPMNLDVVYCGRCGMTLNTFKSEGDREP